MLCNVTAVTQSGTNKSSVMYDDTRQKESGTRPTNGSVVSGCGSVGSWLSSVGSFTVYTPDTQGQGRGSKIIQRAPTLRTS